MKDTSESKLSFLRRNKNFRNLLLAQSTSEIGNWFNSIALMAFVYAESSSGLMIALALLSDAVPALVLSPFSGAIADRFDKRKIMIITDIARAVLALMFLFAGSFFWSLFFVKFLMSVNTSFFKPARQAVIHNIVKSENLITANSLSSMVWGSMSIVGATLGGVVSALVGYEAAFIINAFSFLLSAYFTKKIDVDIPIKDTKLRNIKADIVEGYRFVVKTPMVLSMIFLGMAWGFVGGAFMVLLPIYGAGVYGAGDWGIGTLYAIQGAGILAGGLLVNKLTRGNVYRMKTVYGWSYFFQGLLFIAFALTGNLLYGGIILFFMRVTGGFIIPVDSTLIQHYTPKEMHGRVFSLHMASFGVVLQVAMLTIGFLLEGFSPQTVGVTFGAICVLISIPWLAAFYSGKL